MNLDIGPLPQNHFLEQVYRLPLIVQLAPLLPSLNESMFLVGEHKVWRHVTVTVRVVTVHTVTVTVHIVHAAQTVPTVATAHTVHTVCAYGTCRVLCAAAVFGMFCGCTVCVPPLEVTPPASYLCPIDLGCGED